MFFSDDFQSKDPPKSSEAAGAATRGERVVLSIHWNTLGWRVAVALVLSYQLQWKVET